MCIVLTDGEAGSIPYNNTEVKRDWEDEPYIGTRRCILEAHVFLRDRKLGKTYSIQV